MSRPKIPPSTETDLLVRSRRRCALCFGLDHDLGIKKGQIAHIDHDPKNNDFDNLVWLCLDHHDQYDSRTSQSKGLTQHEVRHYRDDLYSSNQAEDLPSLRLKSQAPAQVLISGAKGRWHYPEIILPVRLELSEFMRPSRETPRRISQDELISHAREGTNIFLVGEAGIGKTTALIDLSEKLLSESDSPIPMFVDAATWASSGKTLLEHIASFSAFVNAGLRAEELSRLNEAGKLLIVINGWNEIGAIAQANARERLQQFIVGSAASKLIIATRSADDPLGITNPKKVTVRGFTWDEQQAFIRQALPPDSAGALLTRLRTNPKLRSVTKNPLVLTGAISLHKSGQVVPDTLYDLLEAIVDAFEAEGARATALRGPPIRGCHRVYLEAIAAAMNKSALTLMPETEARNAVLEAGHKLVDRRLLAQPPEPDDVLEVLCSQHLLHRVQDSSLRFAHQRFQEFFGACVVLARLEKALASDDERDAFQTEILNCPFWEDAIELVAYKLADDQSRRAQARLLLELSLPVDLAYASQLAGMLGLGSDSGAPWQNLRDAIEQMHRHAAPEARQYALHCAAATRSPEFASILWPLLESDDQQVRLRGYRLAGGLSVQQLGPDAIERMAQWLEDRRTESVWEFSHRPDNLEFIERLAQTEPITTVRAAAIRVLYDYYLADDSALDAWLKAPDAVKEEERVLTMALDLWRPEKVALTLELIAFARRSTKEEVKRQVGLRLLDQAEEIGAEAARQSLLEQKYNERDPSVALIAFLKAVDPGFLKNLALERLSQSGLVTDWMRREFSSLPGYERDDLVLKSLERIAAVEYAKLDAAVAEGATEPLVERLLEEGLQLAAAVWSDQRADEITRHRYWAVKRLLEQVPASSLFAAILRRVGAYSYDEAAWIAEILDLRALAEELERSDEEKKIPWRPAIKDLDALIEAVSGKCDTREVSSCRLEAHLVSLASKTDPERYFHLILEGTRRHAQAFNAFDEAVQRYVAQRGHSTRPMNPQYERWFVEALCRCGFDAVPSLLGMANEPGALHIVPQALTAIVADPWEQRREKGFFPHKTYIDDHQNRRSVGRIFRQPDDAHQPVTDEVARFLVQKIETMMAAGGAVNGTDLSKLSPQTYSFWEACKLLARVPSPVGLPTLQDILLREDAQTYHYLDIAQAVIGKGGLLSAGSLKAIRNLWERETAPTWLDQNAQYCLSRLAVLHFFVEPAEEGLTQLKELLPEWLKKVSIWQIINDIGPIPTQEALAVLMELLPRCDSRTDCEERILDAITSNPVPETVNALLDLIETGTLFKYSNMYRFEHSIAQRLKQAAESNEEFMLRLLAVLEAKADATHEALVCAILGDIDSPKARMLVCRYLDEQVYPQGGRHAAHVLRGRFKRRTQSVGASWYEEHPQANQPLRQHLLTLASIPGASQNRARALLLAIEKDRLESGRPAEETRHPAIETGSPWPTFLYAR